MNWLQADSLKFIAKTALSQAQKSIDKVLDIRSNDESPPMLTSSQVAVSQEDNELLAGKGVHDLKVTAGSRSIVNRASSMTDVTSESTTSSPGFSSEYFFDSFLSPGSAEGSSPRRTPAKFGSSSKPTLRSTNSQSCQELDCVTNNTINSGQTLGISVHSKDADDTQCKQSCTVQLSSSLPKTGLKQGEDESTTGSCLGATVPALRFPDDLDCLPGSPDSSLDAGSPSPAPASSGVHAEDQTNCADNSNLQASGLQEVLLPPTATGSYAGVGMGNSNPPTAGDPVSAGTEIPCGQHQDSRSAITDPNGLDILLTDQGVGQVPSDTKKDGTASSLDVVTHGGDSLMSVLQDMRRQLEAKDKQLLENKILSEQSTRDFEIQAEDMEIRYQKVVKERDALRKVNPDVQSLEKQLSELMVMLNEKDEKIMALVEEGERLSKTELNLNNNIKKLKAKSNEQEKTINDLRGANESLLQQNKHLDAQLSTRNESSASLLVKITELENCLDRLEDENNNLKIDFEELQEHNRSLSASLESSNTEIKHLHTNLAHALSEAQDSVTKSMQATRQQLEKELVETKMSANCREEQLCQKICDLQQQVSLMERDFAHKEEMYKYECDHLMKLVQMSTQRNEELLQKAALTSAPLLQQLEQLQNSLVVQREKYVQSELMSSESIADITRKCRIAAEKEKAALESLGSLSAKTKDLESKLLDVQAENTSLHCQLEVKSSRVLFLESEYQRVQEILQTYKAQLEKVQTQTAKEKVLCEQLMSSEKLRLEMEIMKLQTKKFKNTLRDSLCNGVSETPDEIETDGLSSIVLENGQARSSECSYPISMESPNKSVSYFEVEKVQQLLRLRDNDLKVMEGTLIALEKVKKNLHDQLCFTMSENNSLKHTIEQMRQNAIDHQALQIQYNELLHMFGEKVEELEELRLDLTDMKAMYRTQIDHLMSPKT